MADKIDQLTLNGTSYDIDLPPDATPDISSVKAVSTYFSYIYGYTGGTAGITMQGNLVINKPGVNPTLTLSRSASGATALAATKYGIYGIEIDGPLTYKTLSFPNLSQSETIATQTYVLNNAIPYSGATQSVNLSVYGITANDFKLDNYRYMGISGSDCIIENGLGKTIIAAESGVYLYDGSAQNKIAIQDDLYYLTTAPTGSNTTSALKVVTLPSASASTITFKNGYLYVFY